MKNSRKGFFYLFLILFLLTGFVSAQETVRKNSSANSLYLISAKAGGVNFVTGKVAVEKSGKASGYLMQGDEVDVGEIVSTGMDGKTEVLLNPGSYIRLAENSSFEFLSTSLDDLQIQVNKGSAIFEVIADKDFTVSVKMPNSKFYLISAGVFRIDVLSGGEGKISVWKGKAQVGDINATIVKSGKSATQNGTMVAVEKFNRDNKTDFDNWSRDRAKTIAQANAKLMERQMRQSLMNSFNRNVWSASNGYGLWVQDPFNRSFSFLPFGWGWNSPYGFGYSQSIWSYNPPPTMTNSIYQNQNMNNSNVYQPPVNNPPNNGSSNGVGNNGGGQSNPSPPQQVRERGTDERPQMDRSNKGRPSPVID